MPTNTSNIIYREDGTILIKNVRLSYPHLFHPWSQNEFDDNGKPAKKKFSASLIMPVKTHKDDIVALKKHIEELAMTAFKQKLSPERYCVRDGNLNGKEEYAKSWYVAASQTADRAPKVVDRNPKKAVTEESNTVYAGCWVNVLLRPWTQNNQQGGKRVNMNLLTVQFVKDDDSFGDGMAPAPETTFDDISGEFPDEVSGEDLDFSDDDIPF